MVADEPQIRLGSCLSEKIIHPGFCRNRRSRKRVIAGDHDGFDAHALQFSKVFLDTAFHDVFQLHDP